MSRSVCYPVVSGPSKKALSRAIFGRKGGRVPSVIFSFKRIPLPGPKGGYQISFSGNGNNEEISAVAHVLGVRANDHYGESWTVEAHIYVPSGKRKVCFLATIYFRTNTRKGNIRFTPMAK